MIVRIRWKKTLRKPRTRSRTRLVLWLWMLVGVPVCTVADLRPLRAYRPSIEAQIEPITVQHLLAYMRKYRFARPYHANEIFQDAAQNRIPASMMVCIEFAESSGGKSYDHSTSNPFGWDSGRTVFPSESAAIHFISTQLGSGRYYAGKSVREKLLTYNPRPAYAARVMGCMSEIEQQAAVVPPPAK